MRKRGRILLKLENIQVAAAPEETERKVADGFRGMDNEQLVWVLHMLARELNRRSMVMVD